MLEAALQRRCVKRLRAAVPGVLTQRGGGGQTLSSRLGPATAMRLANMEGAEKGTPDLTILAVGCSSPLLAVEFKMPGRRLSKEQRDVQKRYLSQKYGYAIVRTEEDFDLAVNKHFGVHILGHAATAHATAGSVATEKPKIQPLVVQSSPPRSGDGKRKRRRRSLKIKPLVEPIEIEDEPERRRRWEEPSESSDSEDSRLQAPSKRSMQSTDVSLAAARSSAAASGGPGRRRAHRDPRACVPTSQDFIVQLIDDE